MELTVDHADGDRGAGHLIHDELGHRDAFVSIARDFLDGLR